MTLLCVLFKLIVSAIAKKTSIDFYVVCGYYTNHLIYKYKSVCLLFDFLFDQTESYRFEMSIMICSRQKSYK